MKLKKFKYLLSIGATALAIAPIASLTINATNNNNAIVKTNVVNNEDASTVMAPTEPTSVDPTALSPAGNDLYNDYNYESGYVVKSVANHTITFYNWFKQKMWSLDVSTVITSIAGESPSKSLDTMNIRGALTSTGEYDTKLFVYGNLKGTEESESTSGSYVFEVDMNTGQVVNNSLVQNETGTTTTTTDGLIGYVRQLTVIDNSTVIVTSDIGNTVASSSSSSSSLSHAMSVSILTFSNSDTAPTIKTINTDFQNYNFVFGEVLGVIKKESEYVFAVSASDFKYSTNASSSSSSSSSYKLNVYYFWFKESTTGTTTTLTPTKFTETSPMTQTASSSNNNCTFDNVTVLSSIPSSEIFGDTSPTTTTIDDVNKVHLWLEDKCTNFSVVYPGTAANPKMMVSYNWDTTDISPDVGTSDFGKTKVTLVQFGNPSTSDSTNKDAVVFAIYTMPATIANSISTLGISNLVYTRSSTDGGSTFVQPYAVIVGQANTNSKPSIWFNLVKLDTTTTSDSAAFNSALTNNSTTTGTTTDGNTMSNAYTAGCFGTTDLYTENGAALNNNINKMDWQLQFIPGNGTAASIGGQVNTYYGYITTGYENPNTKTVDYQENFISLPTTAPSSGSKNVLAGELDLQGYQFGITDDQIANTYRALTESDSTINSKSFASEATKTALLADLEQAYSYKAVDSNPNTDGTVNVTADSWQAVSGVTYDKSNLSADEANGTISGTVSYSLKNWWNDETTEIVRNINLQLSKPADFSTANLASSLTEGTDKTVQDWLQAKYSFDTLFPTGQTTASDQLISFVKDILTTANLGSNSDSKTLRTILINSLPSSSTTPSAGEDGQKAGTEGTENAEEGAKVEQSSAKLHSAGDGNNNGAIQVGQYVTVTPGADAKSATTVKLDLSSATGLTSAAPVTMQFQGFTGLIDQNSPEYASYDSWSGHQSPAEEQNTPQTPTNNSNNSGSSSLSGGAIAGIIIAVLVVIALIIGIYFFVKKRKNIQ